MISISGPCSKTSTPFDTGCTETRRPFVSIPSSWKQSENIKNSSTCASTLNLLQYITLIDLPLNAGHEECCALQKWKDSHLCSFCHLIFKFICRWFLGNIRIGEFYLLLLYYIRENKNSIVYSSAFTFSFVLISHWSNDVFSCYINSVWSRCVF